jgi:hypothetical protein
VNDDSFLHFMHFFSEIILLSQMNKVIVVFTKQAKKKV